MKACQPNGLHRLSCHKTRLEDAVADGLTAGHPMAWCFLLAVEDRSFGIISVTASDCDRDGPGVSMTPRYPKISSVTTGFLWISWIISSTQVQNEITVNQWS